MSEESKEFYDLQTKVLELQAQRDLAYNLFLQKSNEYNTLVKEFQDMCKHDFARDTTFSVDRTYYICKKCGK